MGLDLCNSALDHFYLCVFAKHVGVEAELTNHVFVRTILLCLEFLRRIALMQTVTTCERLRERLLCTSRRL